MTFGSQTHHMFLFTDGSPEDRLADGHEERWHTQAFFAYDAPFFHRFGFETVLNADPYFTQMIATFGHLRKWARARPRYKDRFAKTLKSFDLNKQPHLNAISYKESHLRAAEQKLLQSLNRSMLGRAFGFERIGNAENPMLRHSYVNMTGFHVLERPENQMLVLILVARAIVDQYSFYAQKLRQQGILSMQMTVVSDRLAGDGDNAEAAKHLLHFMLDPCLYWDSLSHHQIFLTRSPVSDQFSADLLVDNYAGYLNRLVMDSDPALTQSSLVNPAQCMVSGWNLLDPYDHSNDFVLALGKRNGSWEIKSQFETEQ
jgi:hypothetical protein